MLSNSDIRRKGNESLRGNYLTAIGNFVIITIISSTLQSLFSPEMDYTVPISIPDTFMFDGDMTLSFTASIVTSFVVALLSLGLHWGFLDIQDGDRMTVGHLFAPFKNEPLKVAGYIFQKQLFIMLWSLLFIIPGIVKSYAWAMADFIYYDEPTLPNREILAKSDALMQGEKWRLFRLELYYSMLYIAPILVWLGGVAYFLIRAFDSAYHWSNFAFLWFFVGLLFVIIISFVLAIFVEPRRNSARAAFYMQL